MGSNVCKMKKRNLTEKKKEKEKEAKMSQSLCRASFAQLSVFFLTLWWFESFCSKQNDFKIEITVNEQTTELKHKLDARSTEARFTLRFCRAELPVLPGQH